MFKLVFERANVRALLIAAACFVVILLVFSPDFGLYWGLVGWQGDVVLLDMEFFNFYGVEHADAVLDRMAAGRYCPYLGFYLLDTAFLVAYFFMLSFSIALIYKRIPAGRFRRHLLLIAPFATALCDFLENLLIVLMVLVPQVREMGAAQATSLVMNVKWIALAVTAAIIVAGLAWSIFRRFSSGSTTVD
jgi:hypothetical protein